MTFEIVFTLFILLVILGLLFFSRFPPDTILLGGLTILLLVGILTPAEALKGFSNEGMITVGVLYIVVAGLRETGGILWIVHRVLGRPKNLMSAQINMMFPVMGLSAFLNNTPVVSMFIPAVMDWAKQNKLPVSKLLIPLSYASIFGGICTLIGTSTNLVVNGMIISETDIPSLSMFEITWIGLPCALLGALYIMLFSKWLLPDSQSSNLTLENPKEYTVEMMVEDESPLIGRSIEQAGLRNLPGLFLIEIERENTILPAVSPQEKLRANDRLVFVGIVDSIVDLHKIRGLKPATNQIFKLDTPRLDRIMIETVVSNSCPIIGKTIRDGRFRTKYNAVVIAVARNGRRLKQKIGDIILQPGDSLLLETHPSFFERQKYSQDFFLISRVENSEPLRHEKGYTALAILLGMVILAGFGFLSMLKAAMLASGLMIFTGCCSGNNARDSVDWQVLLVIASSFGIGHALLETGAANLISENMIKLAGGSPWIALAIVYMLTTCFTEIITNNAAAVLIFPIAYVTAQNLDVSFLPYAITIMIGASASFSTPIGYQTNLMVYGPGGYQFSDYLKVGIPLNLLFGVATVLLCPFIWKF